MLTRKEIANPLEVDLHVRHLDKVLKAWVRVNDGGEDLFCNSRNNATQVVVVDIRTLHKGNSFHLSMNFFHEGTQKPRTIIVNVFPEPVCPYAKTVPLYPSMTSSNARSAQTLHCFTK